MGRRHMAAGRGVGCGSFALLASWCLLGWSLLAPAPSAAASLVDIRSGGERAQAELQQLSRSGQPDFAAEKRLIERLAPLVLSFIDDSDRALQSGSTGGEASRRSAFEAVQEPLDRIYRWRNDSLEKKARAVMDQDGDLEALYDTEDWKQSQEVAAQALYYLNWLDYYGARLYEGERRKKLLEAAERGFSEFAVGDRQSDLITESLLGRGLCHLELGNYDWAVRDFRMVVDQQGASAERKSKARLALLDTYVRAGKQDDALSYSEQLLKGGDIAAADVPLVRFYRLQTLFDAIDRTAKGKEEAYRRQASAVMEQLRHAGKGWAKKVDALLLSRVDDPAKWADKPQSPEAKWELAKMLLQKNDDAAAAPLLEEIAAGDSDPNRRAEAAYWLGVARFKAGDYTAAADRFDAALAGAQPSFAATASYLRFKALEALMARQPTSELGDRYLAAVQSFLRDHPDHPSAAEARYRLGEYRQTRGEYEAAIEAYGEVHGDPGFELRARFGALQSDFELLKRADPSQRGARLDAVGESLRRFWEQTAAGAGKELGDVPLKEFEAKASLLKAVYLSLRGADGNAEVAKLLADFDQRFPGQKDLLPQAVRLRLAALRQLGRFEDAEAEMKAHAQALREENRTDAIEQLAAGFAKAGAQRRKDGAADALAADRVALQLYGLIDGGPGTANVTRELTVARLNESTGNLAVARSIYERILADNGSSLTSLRGLARIAEQSHDRDAALHYWTRYTEVARPGDGAWYRGRYEQARLELAAGDKKRSCEMLEDLRPAMPGLSDAELRARLDTLYTKACG